MANFKRVGSDDRPIIRTTLTQSGSSESTTIKKNTPSNSDTKSERWCRVYLYSAIIEALGKKNSSLTGSQQNLQKDISNYKDCLCQFEVRGHEALVSSLSFCPSGVFVASCCEKGLVNIWSIQVNMKKRKTILYIL